MAKLIVFFLITMVGTATSLFSEPAPEGASVYIISPSHGEVVQNPITIRLGLKGFGIAPAGVERPNTGHHHLLIDVEKLPPLDSGIPADKNHRHLGGGQTEMTLELPPGKHTLQLLLGDKAHVPHTPPLLSEKITITVENKRDAD